MAAPLATSTITPDVLEKLHAFVDYWKDFQGTEQAGSQSFLNKLLDAYGVSFHPGTIFEQHPVLAKPKPEDAQGSLFGQAASVTYSQERMDMYLPKICVWEMKAPDEKDLRKHHNQLLRYWSAGELPELQTLHDALNDAVTACYNWPAGLWRDDNAVLHHLLALNYEIAERGENGQGILGAPLNTLQQIPLS